MPWTLTVSLQVPVTRMVEPTRGACWSAAVMLGNALVSAPEQSTMSCALRAAGKSRNPRNNTKRTHDPLHAKRMARGDPAHRTPTTASSYILPPRVTSRAINRIVGDIQCGRIVGRRLAFAYEQCQQVSPVGGELPKSGGHRRLV